jgi:endonuclease/exonuclease/phosphatase family metal-dependent hydrolase
VDVDDPVRSTAALLQTPLGPLLVYGTVLPWHTDPGPHGNARAWSEHHRVIPLQGVEWARLATAHPDAALCVAGDFNTNLGGRHYYGTAEGRGLLRASLDGAGLLCATEAERVPEGMLRYPPIDHICLSKRLADQAVVVDAWDGTTVEGAKLSDHSGLVVEVR